MSRPTYTICSESKQRVSDFSNTLALKVEKCKIYGSMMEDLIDIGMVEAVERLLSFRKKKHN